MSDIHAALAAVMDDCTHVAKRDRNEHQRFLFRGIDAVVNAVGPILRKHAVTVRPVVQSVSYDIVQTSTGKPASACRVVVDYIFGAPDGSEVTATVAAEAWDNGDKAAPKAMSVAFRTALLQTLALPTDEPDPDARSYERAPAAARAAQADEPATEPAATRKMSRPSNVRPGGVDGADPVSARTRGRIFAQLAELWPAADDDQQRALFAWALGIESLASRKDITEEMGLRIEERFAAEKARRATAGES